MKTVVYIDKEEEDEDHDLYVDLHVINKSSQNDILAYEIECTGGQDVLEEWEYLELDQGYYYADYDVRMESEYEDGYVAYSYGVLDNLLLDPMPFWKGSLISRFYNYKHRLERLRYLVSSLFKRRWRYDADSGGAGLSHTNYVWVCVYYYIIKKDLGWGSPVERSFYLE